MDPKRTDRAKKISKRLLVWFDKNKRDFPWRDDFRKLRPYAILFTEIMLQRTRASQVVPVYLEFVHRYPTFEHLAVAPDSEVLMLFSRLGLTGRARNVVKLIHVLKREFNGEIPTDISELRELPGVGIYVATAVSCYAFGKRVVAIDANVVRVVSRLFGLSVSLDVGRRSKKVSEYANSFLLDGQSARLNLSLLDFAAQVCRPKPLCQSCPLTDQCDYYNSRSLAIRG